MEHERVTAASSTLQNLELTVRSLQAEVQQIGR
jgi:hypothetical protein